MEQYVIHHISNMINGTQIVTELHLRRLITKITKTMFFNNKTALKHLTKWTYWICSITVVWFHAQPSCNRLTRLHPRCHIWMLIIKLRYISHNQSFPTKVNFSYCRLFTYITA